MAARRDTHVEAHVEAIEGAVATLQEEAAGAPPSARAIIEEIARRAWVVVHEVGNGHPCPARGAANLVALAAGVIMESDAPPEVEN